MHQNEKGGEFLVGLHLVSSFFQVWLREIESEVFLKL